jgi:leucyl aminopeptidase (aminopeptidase T)
VKDVIAESVLRVVKGNMGVKEGENVLVLADVPSIPEWKGKSLESLQDFVSRLMLARTVSGIIQEEISGFLSGVKFHPYPSCGGSGREPDSETSQLMKAYDVILAMTTHSLTHTVARSEATALGRRVASMPGVTAEMFYPEGALFADLAPMKEETERIARILTGASSARVVSKNGTDLHLGLKGRSAKADTGVLDAPGAWGNLPAGEAYIAPLEGTCEGVLVVSAGWYPELERPLTITFKEGAVTEVEGGGRVGDGLRELLESGMEPRFPERRNCAELGLGTNPCAKRPDNLLEAEKIRGTVHIAIGDSSHMGGNVSADVHEDFVVANATLYLDGVCLMKDGVLDTECLG